MLLDLFPLANKLHRFVLNIFGQNCIFKLKSGFPFFILSFKVEIKLEQVFDLTVVKMLTIVKMVDR